jgi:hypothetical protein
MTVRKIKWILMVGMIAVLASCHGSGGDYKLRFVNTADSAQVVELKMHNPNVLARVHMAVFSQKIKGSYVLKKGDETVEGRVVLDEKGYTLESKDGKKQRFEPQPSGELKDDSGATWKLDSPTATVVVKELKGY